MLSSWVPRGTIVGLLALAAIPLQAQAQTCTSTTLGSFAAGATLDGRSFKLADGREVLLAGIEVPPGGAAQAALEKMLADRTIVLKPAEPVTDRYGRLIAHAFVVRDGAERWVQQELLAAGAAQVGPRPGDAACAKALLAEEAPARRARRGIWADSAFGIRASDDLAGLLARRGRFTVAEGKVLSVRESGGTIYINFGRVWSRNLTVTILRRNKPVFDAVGMDPKKLEGMRVRVRGWIEDRNGPRMEAMRPEQIEMAARE